MALGKSLSAVSIDEAWSDLRHHLDWTQGKGTLVFIATESRAQAESLRERAALWAQRTNEPWTRAPANESTAPWLRRHLPQPGILWVELWDDAARLAALHVLNEVRIRFARPGGGCLVLCGPVRRREEAAHEAADLSLSAVSNGPSGPSRMRWEAWCPVALRQFSSASRRHRRRTAATAPSGG